MVKVHKPAERSGSELPNFKEMSETELLQFACGQESGFLGAMRRAIQTHARRAGMALIELRERKGSYGFWRWLKEDSGFLGSVESAKVYLRIAENWDTIVKAGFETNSLADMRRLLKKEPDDKDKDDRKDDGSSKTESETITADEDGAETPASSAETSAPPVVAHIKLKGSDEPQWNEWIGYLSNRLNLDEHAVVFEAVRRTFEEVRQSHA